MIFIRQWLIANAGDVPERNSCPVKWFVAFILGIVPTISTISTAKFINRSSPEGMSEGLRWRILKGRVYPHTVCFLLPKGCLRHKILNRQSLPAFAETLRAGRFVILSCCVVIGNLSFGE